MTRFRTILADPPWAQSLMGKRTRKRDPDNFQELPYKTLDVEAIKRLPVGDLADTGCHLWLWTTNQFINAGFDVMQAWGFKYLAPIHWIKPSGCGNYFIHRSQTLLFGYKEKCQFNRLRYTSNVIFAKPGQHSSKPSEAYELIESVSDPQRVELFARSRRDGWSVWGNEVVSDVELDV